MRALLTAPLALVWTAAFGIPAALSGAVDRSGHLPWRIARAWGRVLLRTWGVRVQVNGAEQVPAGPAVYAANHASALDIPILFGHLPAEFRVIHKRSLYWAPVVGQYLFLGGHIGVQRGRAAAARRSLARAAARIRAGTSVAVFPEGTRSGDPRVQPFKRGSFVLAIRAGVPVVPVSISGVKALAPRGMLLLTPGTVTMTLHAPQP
ncbi:MAG TPA: lysophospholipid acyltransferase family protein, partial [Vicinamibacteria bacterium]|nr:lysophospholipid acyltransferase family protein [Vicinamibacteria bacterium]